MNMPQEVCRAAENLLAALRRTDTFTQYEALRQNVMADEVNRRLLDRFSRAQTALQMAAMAGSEPREEDAAEFEKLSALLYQSEEVTDYLLAQMRAQQLVAQTLEKLTNAVGLNVDIKET